MLESTQDAALGDNQESNDPEFDDYNRRFGSLESAIEKLIKDTRIFSEAVTNLFTTGHGFAQHFSALFHPLAGEYDLLGKHPEAEHTVKNVDAYEGALEELRSLMAPELELIESRILGPMKEVQGIMKTIRKTINKREHKLVDFDRYNNSLTKLRDKKEKTLNDEKNLFKLEQDFEIASNEYEYINTSLKTELPKFMQMAAQFIDPLFHSFFYMQLNVFYLLLEKLSGFAEGRYDVTVTAAQIAVDYEEKRGDVSAQVEELNITKRIASVSKMVQANRSASGGGAPGLAHKPSVASSGSRGLAAPPARSTSSASSNSTYTPKSLPPPAAAVGAPPPPYSPSANSVTKPNAFGAAGVKKGPPPPPPLKSKPNVKAAEYVTALYDFEAQAEGDLDFKAGDRIEIVEKSESVEDWWTGRLEGRQGVFPGNYVQ
ncbi:hypothetical protein EUX98_g1582 [Antrodiella citrinella]|uniref:SH3 domain-containing protein n=1 Tax=Antrodiella citrinella TaxID=2447956 RepID=A0A4V3XJD1_9APHY|nr:hypothetical protein EUX98_g1582 [Antrodiella citrinella]